MAAHAADSLLHSEHRYRQKMRERGLLDVSMQRIDVRVQLLQSIATQATLVTGIAFGCLCPEVLDSLLLDDMKEQEKSFFGQCFKTAFVTCAAVSFAASIWVM